MPSVIRAVETGLMRALASSVPLSAIEKACFMDRSVPATFRSEVMDWEAIAERIRTIAISSKQVTSANPLSFMVVSPKDSCFWG